MEPAFIMAKKTKNKLTIWRYKKKEGEPKKPNKEITYFEIGMIFLSGAIFSSFHVNYYGQLNLILMVFVGGVWLSISYFWHKDLTPVILAHFLLNIIFAVQFYQVVGMG